MPTIREMLSSWAWWFSAVGVALAINLAAAYLKPWTDQRFARRVHSWKLRWLFGAKVAQPVAGVIAAGRTALTGRYRFRFGFHYAVFRYDGQKYWPQAPVTFDEANGLWASSVFVAHAPNAAQTIILAAITDDLKTLTDYYGQVHNHLMREHGLDLWVPIHFHSFPPGMIELDRIVVYSKV